MVTSGQKIGERNLYSDNGAHHYLEEQSLSIMLPVFSLWAQMRDIVSSLSLDALFFNFSKFLRGFRTAKLVQDLLDLPLNC